MKHRSPRRPVADREMGRMRVELAAANKELKVLYAALGNIKSGVLLLNKDLYAQYSNPALHTMFNSFSSEKIRAGNLHFSELLKDARTAYSVSSDELDAHLARRLERVRSGDPKPDDIHLSSGRVIRCHCTVLPNGGRMMIYSDVTDIVRHAEEFERLATTDGMTGIYNRRHFLALADREWNRSQRYSRALSILMIDIDFFKAINDSFGHEIGDHMIVHLVNLVSEFKRESDVLARIGGEEFALLLPETSLTQARSIAERVRLEVSISPLVEASRRLTATVSIGAAAASETMGGIADLMKAADNALYEAKRCGRNRVVCSASEANVAPVMDSLEITAFSR